jgi:gamma-F420-2:alpha-L-glutamate ligase
VDGGDAKESMMKCWILHNLPAGGPEPDIYEIDRFRKTAEEESVELGVLTPEQFDLIVSRDDRKSVRIDGKTVSLPDFLLPRMGSSAGYFALAVIRHLERLNVRSFNRSSAIEAVKDKLYTQQVLAASDLPFAKTMLVRFPVDVDLVEKVIGFPAVVKTISGSKGVGVFLSEGRSEFTDLMGLVNAVQGSTSIIIQELVESSMGRDLRVITIGGRAVACMMRTASPDSFKANFSAGGSVSAYQMTPEIEWLAVEASRIFDLDVAGVDLLFDNDHFRISEVNSAPGFRGLEQSQDFNMPRAIFDFVRVRLGMPADVPAGPE